LGSLTLSSILGHQSKVKL
jgi:hypothetical protein